MGNESVLAELYKHDSSDPRPRRGIAHKDLRLEIRPKNNTLLRLILQRYPTLRAFSRATDVSYASLCQIICLYSYWSEKSPLAKKLVAIFGIPWDTLCPAWLYANSNRKSMLKVLEFGPGQLPNFLDKCSDLLGRFDIGPVLLHRTAALLEYKDEYFKENGSYPNISQCSRKFHLASPKVVEALALAECPDSFLRK